MRIYIHSADTGVIHRALSSGFVYGVTTNPTILRNTGVSARQVSALVQQATGWGAQEIHLQVYSEKVPDMVKEGQELAALNAERVVVRVPATAEGYMAAAQLTAQGIRVSITAVYNLRQALLAENVGASSVAVYLRRMHEAGIDGLAQLGHMQRMLGIQRSSVELMGASIREPVEIVEKLAMLGIKSATLAASVLDDLLHSPATAEAARTFREDGDFIINQSAEVGAH